MGMPVLSTVERVAGIYVTARKPGPQAIIEAPHKREGYIYLKGRKAARLLFLTS